MNRKIIPTVPATQSEVLPAQLAYEASVRQTPNYHDGSPRVAWHELSDIARWSWGRVYTDKVGELR